MKVIEGPAKKGNATTFMEVMNLRSFVVWGIYYLKTIAGYNIA